MKETINQILLRQLLSEMDVPEFRRFDYRWLLRNLAIRNGDHPRFNDAIEMIKKELTAKL